MQVYEEANVLSAETCASLIKFFEAAPKSKHLSRRDEAENIHQPSMSISLRDQRGKHTLLSDVKAAMLRSSSLRSRGFAENEFLFRRFSIRRYEPATPNHATRDSCDWHTDVGDLSVLFWVGGSFEGGDLVIGPNCETQLRLQGNRQHAGTMVLFEGGRVLHMAEPVTSGVRYVGVIFMDRRPPPRRKRARFGESDVRTGQPQGSTNSAGGQLTNCQTYQLGCNDLMVQDGDR